jgi:hypothetical protein
VPKSVLTSALAFLIAGLLTASVPVSSAAGDPSDQSDLDAFMQKVVARRDENWKKIQQYVLDETETVQVRGPSELPVWGDKREYTWFIKDGYFVRSPLKANGVTIQEDERRKYEENFLRRAKNRDKRAAEQKEKEKEKKRTESGEVQAERVPEEAPPAPATFDAFLSQTRQPQFIDSAYFLKFKFEQGKYALVGRETVDGREVLRIEYYPTKLFSHTEHEAQRAEEQKKQDPNKKEEQKKPEDKRWEETINRMMNKVSLVTIWVEPKDHQIVKYTFDNVHFDFLPAAWLLRVNDLKASMTMSQPVKDVKDLWLPQTIDWYFSAMLAIGEFDVRYHLQYHDYRQATTSGRIKGGTE